VNRKDMIDVRVHRVGNLDDPNRNSTEADPASVAGVIVGEATRQMEATLDQRTVRWMDAPLPIDPRLRRALEWGLLRLEIVSSPSPLGKSCVLGDIRSCRVFLGLDSVANPIKIWYDSIGRRRLVMKDHDYSLHVSRTATERCDAGDDAGCVAVLELMGTADRAPASAYVRQSIIVHALNLGGERSPERLVLAPGSVSAALAAAANRPVDSLLTDWQGNVARHGGSSTNLPWSIAIGSIVWIVVCTLLALRSSRWR
jgi:hypothetical protein